MLSLPKRLRGRKLVQSGLARLPGSSPVFRATELRADRSSLPMSLQRGIRVSSVIGVFMACDPSLTSPLGATCTALDRRALQWAQKMIGARYEDPPGTWDWQCVQAS